MASFLNYVFGAKPDVAKPKMVDLGAEQAKATGSNISNFPQTAKLGDLYTSYLQGQIEKQLPGYSQILKSGAQNTQAVLDAAAPMLHGQIPQDVQDQIRRSDAFQGLLSGTSGSDMNRALTARDLGLTSLDLIGKGATLNAMGGNSAQNWSRIAEETAYNPSNMFITPGQQEAVTAKNNALKQTYQQTKFNVAAAPDPVAKGISDTIMSVILAYIGKGGGGGGNNTGSGPSNPYSQGVPSWSEGTTGYDTGGNAWQGQPIGDYGGSWG